MKQKPPLRFRPPSGPMVGGLGFVALVVLALLIVVKIFGGVI